MTIRTDLTIDWTASPRIITVASPSTEISIQDLYDTCMSMQAEADAIDEYNIINAAGKEDLGGGSSVGLTATLQNALLAFEDRAGPNFIQCYANGGNLVAVGSDLITYETTPIHPTDYVQVVVIASSALVVANDVTINVADIFNEDLTPYTVVGTFGQWLNDKGLTAQKFLGLK